MLQTATAGTLGSSGSYVATGDGTDAGSSFIGTTFTLNSSTNTLQVGGNFDTNGIGSAFAEVVSLSSLTASGLLNGTGTVNNAVVNYLQGNNLGSSVFNAPTSAGDASTVINFGTSLAAGNYALIFGSGLFGATGGSAFGAPYNGSVTFTDTANGNVAIGSPTIFNSLGNDNFTTYGFETDIRIFAATPVPLPAALPLMLSGIAGFGIFRRSRRSR